MMYLWIVIAAVVGAVGAWFFLDKFGQRDMKKLRQENEQLRKKVQSQKLAPINFTETKATVQSVHCDTYVPMEDLDDPKKVAESLERSTARGIAQTILQFCNIQTVVEPAMNQLIVRTRLQVVLPDKPCNIYEELMHKAAEYRRSTAIGPEQFAAGNLGALNFAMEAYALNARRAEEGFLKMLAINVVGDKLYMLWNDCCDRDTALAVAVMNNLTEGEILRHINYEQGRGIPFTDEEKEKLRYE